MTMMFTSSNPISTLSQHAWERPRDVAFWFAGRGWRYDEFARESLALARGLSRLGLKKGDIVVAHMNNRPEMLLVYASCMHLGAIVAPLRPAFKYAELLPLLKRLNPALYIGEAEFYSNLADVDPSVLPFAKRYVVGNVPDGRVGHWSEKLDRNDGRDVPIVVDADAPVVLICTSGTTGVPKLVCHTQATASAIIAAVIKIRRGQDDDVTTLHMGLAHASGFFMFLINLHDHVPFVLMTYDPDAMLDVIARYRCTFLLSFPSQYAAMIARQQSRPRQLHTLRVCYSGGDVCPLDLQENASAVLGCELLNWWGASETLGPLTFGVKPGAVCRIPEGHEFRLIDKDGNDVPRGEIGEFCARGPYIFAGYWNQPEATAEVIKDGWYHSGDLMRRGDGDEIWFVGRMKDIIVRGGAKISPVEVEETLVAVHPAVTQAAVVGIPDETLGQRVVGFIVLANGGAHSISGDVLAAVSERLAAFKVPEWLAVVPDLPLNHLGKIDRKALVAVAQQRHGDQERRERLSS